MLTLCIVKIGWKPEDVVLMKGSKKDIKNVDYMIINYMISNCKRIYVLPSEGLEVIFATDQGKIDQLLQVSPTELPQNIESSLPHFVCPP